MHTNANRHFLVPWLIYWWLIRGTMSTCIIISVTVLTHDEGHITRTHIFVSFVAYFMDEKRKPLAFEQARWMMSCVRSRFLDPCLSDFKTWYETFFERAMAMLVEAHVSILTAVSRLQLADMDGSLDCSHTSSCNLHLTHLSFSLSPRSRKRQTTPQTNKQTNKQHED
jgi:hypothetical protein